MEGNKKTYYIKVETGEITQSATDSPWDFKIEASDDEINTLRQYFTQTYTTEWQSFWRAHVPYIEYHHDRENDEYDQKLKEIYGMIYELGDSETRSHIASMGILEGYK